jgi:hypothetical protein
VPDIEEPDPQPAEPDRSRHRVRRRRRKRPSLLARVGAPLREAARIVSESLSDELSKPPPEHAERARKKRRSSSGHGHSQGKGRGHGGRESFFSWLFGAGRSVGRSPAAEVPDAAAQHAHRSSGRREGLVGRLLSPAKDTLVGPEGKAGGARGHFRRRGGRSKQQQLVLDAATAAVAVVVGLLLWRGSPDLPKQARAVVEQVASAGQRVRGESVPLVTEFVAFFARPSGSGVELTWETASELEAVAFTVARTGLADDCATVVTVAEVPRRGSPLDGDRYSVHDRPGSGTFFYTVRAVELEGEAVGHGPVRVRIGDPELVGALSPRIGRP